MKAKVTVVQLCLTLCDPMYCTPPGFSVHEILQARIPEWVSISFSRGSSRPRDQAWVSYIADGFFTVWATRESCEWLRVFSFIKIYNWSCSLAMCKIQCYQSSRREFRYMLLLPQWVSSNIAPYTFREYFSCLHVFMMFSQHSGTSSRGGESRQFIPFYIQRENNLSLNCKIRIGSERSFEIIENCHPKRIHVVS